MADKSKKTDKAAEIDTEAGVQPGREPVPQVRAAGDGEKELLWVEPGPNAAPDRVILWDTDPAHPEGQVFISQNDPYATQVGRSGAVLQKIATGELKEAGPEAIAAAEEARQEQDNAPLQQRAAQAVKDLADEIGQTAERASAKRAAAKKAAGEDKPEEAPTTETAPGYTMLSGGGGTAESAEARTGPDAEGATAKAPEPTKPGATGSSKADNK